MSWLVRAEDAHRDAVNAASEGLADAGLGERRLAGDLVRELADAAVTSATPFLRAPLLAAMHEALVLHQADGEPATCTTCGTEFPCETVRALTPVG